MSEAADPDGRAHRPVGPEERAQREARRAARALAMGARVKGLRGFRRYTQAHLAGLTGLSSKYLSRFERGGHPCPRPGTVERLAGALGVTVAQLRGDESLPERPGDGEAAEAVAEAMTEASLMVRVLTLIADLPPGVAVTHQRYADGGILVYIRPPGAADRVPERDGG